MTHRLELLIIEDNTAEAIYAQKAALEAGLKGVRAVTELKSALELISEKPKMIVSDLFFPAGGVDRTEYIQRLMPHYEAMEKRYGEMDPQQNLESPVRAAVEMCAEAFGMTPQEYVENVMAKLNTPKMVMEAARNAVYNVKDYERWQKVKKAESDMRTGENFPSGIFVVEKAKELEIPVMIVTSTNHHDIAFEVIRELVTAQYYDTLDAEGKKQWTAAIKDLLQERT